MSSWWNWKLPLVAAGTAAAAIVLYYLFQDDDDEPRPKGAGRDKGEPEEEEQGLHVTQEEMMMLQQAQALFADGQYEKALEARMGALGVLKREWGTADVRVFITAMNFGGEYVMKRRFKEALPLLLDANETYDQMDAIKKKQLEQHHVNLRVLTGDTMFGLGFYTPATEHHRAALELIRPHDPKGIVCVFFGEKLAKSLAADGKSAEAIRVMSSAVSFALMNNKGSSVVYDGQCVLAELQAQEKNLQAAEELLRMMLSDIAKRSPALAVGAEEPSARLPMSAPEFRAMRLLRSICFDTGRDADALDIERRMGLSPVCVPHISFESSSLLEVGCAIVLYSLGQDMPFGTASIGRRTAFARLRLYLARSWGSNPELAQGHIVVHFRKPDGAMGEDVVEHTVSAEERAALEVEVESPRLLAATKGNYLAVVDVYESSRKAKKLGSLRQFVHCRYDLEAVTASEASQLEAAPDRDFQEELKPPPGAERAVDVRASGAGEDDEDDEDDHEHGDESFRPYDDEELAAVMAEYEKE